MRKRYKCHKEVHATPMNRLDYNIYRGWELPDNEDGSDKGYLVEYVNGGPTNDPRHEGYISWSPKEQFDDGYNECGEFITFGEAVEQAKLGHRIERIGWNGKSMWVCLMPPLFLENEKVNGRTLKFIGTANLDCQPYFAMWTAAEQWQPGWLASQADTLAVDWRVVPGSIS